MIIVDFSNIAVSCVMLQAIGKRDVPPGSDMLRHLILDSVRRNVSLFNKTDKNVVLAFDGQRSWRKDVFKYYKAHRKAGRDKYAAKINWTEFYALVDQLEKDLAEYFPYTVVRSERAEGDDVIGTLVAYEAERNPHETITIIGGDGDYLQLLKYDNVQQYRFVQQELIVRSDTNDRLGSFV